MKRSNWDDEVERIKTIISELAPVLVIIVRNAWAAWVRDFVGKLPACPVRARRNVMWALMLQEAKLQLSDSTQIDLKETKQGHVLFIVRGSFKAGTLILRFKHLHSDFTTRNYPTRGAIMYARQLPLFDIPLGRRVDVGYTLDNEEASLTGIFWVLAMGDRVIWRENLIPEDDRTIPMFEEKPAAAAARRVTKKKGKGDKETGSGG